MKKLLVLLSTVMILPTFVLAATDLSSFLGTISGLFGNIYALLLTAAVLAFMYGLLMFIFKPGEGDKGKKHKDVMIWAIVALFLMVSVWGIVRMLQNTFFTSGDVGTAVSLPPLPR
ncbi:MAG: hypothetical protein KAI16_02625 [Candidatus Pacebacteria bacterium]|nr:hypothetical protein [Candidatus Paceibacterota bacterium]